MSEDNCPQTRVQGQHALIPIRTHSGTGPAPSISAYYNGGPHSWLDSSWLGGEHQAAPPTMLATSMTTPLVTDTWTAALQSHPTWEWVECCVTDMKEGFDIGLLSEPCCQSSPSNTPSATLRKDVISNLFSSQCRAGYMLGPVPVEGLCRGHHQLHGSYPQENSKQVEGHCGPVVPAESQ